MLTSTNINLLDIKFILTLRDEVYLWKLRLLKVNIPEI